MEKTVILGVKLNQRQNLAADFQKIITEYGCNIKTRIGIHNASNGKCSSAGVILLDLIGTDEEIKVVENAIKALPEVELQKMIFNQT
jgi:hypothetical protein